MVSALTRPVSLLNTQSFLEKNKNKKFITISPGGLAGFYMLGIVTYIQENYDTSDFQILGASAGAWNSLPMVYKGSIHDITQDILCNYRQIAGDDEITSIYQLQNNIQKLITIHYDEEDFDLNRVNIGTTSLTKTGFEQLIICDISTLQQATDSCIASSHIPFITGKVPKINNKTLFDGAFQRFPPETINNYLSITPNLWKRVDNDNIQEYLNIKNLKTFENLYEKGYVDSFRHRKILDLFLLD
jgi:hypothetical protein